MDQIIKKIKSLRKSPLANSTLTYTVNFGLQLFIQLAYFILMSRYLGPTSYGIFITIGAINGFANFLIGLGSDHLMIQRVAVNRELFARYFGHALMMATLTFPIVAVLSFAICFSLVGQDVAIVSLVVLTISHNICGRINVFCANVFMAFDRPRMQLWVNVFISAARAVFLLIAIFIHGKGLTLEIWIWWYFAASLVSAVQAAILVLITSGIPAFTIIKNDLLLGFQYCLEALATAGVTDLDKPTITTVLGAELAGIYGAGFRIVNAACAPVRALLYASYTRHFRNASSSPNEAIRFGKSLLPYAFGLSAGVAFCLIAFADIIPILIGEEFERSTDIIRVFALLPFFMGLSGIAADILRALGKQLVRITLLIGTALLMVPSVYIGAIYGGIVGAAAGRIILQLLLVVACWLALSYFGKQTRAETDDNLGNN